MKTLLDPGHGGIAFGHYLTPGKRSPDVPPGIYEGEFNRIVCNKVERLNTSSFLNIAPGPINIPLKSRVSFVNQIAKREPSILISVHCNAAGGSGWSSARGLVVWLSNRASKNSKKLARIALEQMTEALKGYIEPRSTPIRTANHTITTQTNCPAILIEVGFMTNLPEAALLASNEIKNMTCNGIARTVTEYKRS